MNNIKALRESKNIKQNTLAASAGYKQSCFSHYERDEREITLHASRRIIKGMNSLGIECTDLTVWPLKNDAA